jgi:hypothetical protein
VLREVEEAGKRLSKILSIHVHGISAERLVLQRSMPLSRCLVRFPAAAHALAPPLVVNAMRREAGSQRFTTEVGMTLGARIAANISKKVDAGAFENLQKLVHRPGPMPNRKDAVLCAERRP